MKPAILEYKIGNDANIANFVCLWEKPYYVTYFHQKFSTEKVWILEKYM